MYRNINGPTTVGATARLIHSLQNMHVWGAMRCKVCFPTRLISSEGISRSVPHAVLDFIQVEWCRQSPW